MHGIYRSIVVFFPRLIVAAIIAGVLILQPRLGESPAAAQATTGATSSVWISETGQTMSGAFLAYWIANPEIGNPVSGAVMQGELWTQWFEYARLELEPGPYEAMTIEQVNRHQIGRSFAERAGYTEGLAAFKPLAEGQDRFFPETGHSLTMGFRTAYEQPGVDARLGMPISEEFDIGTVTYQFFEFGAFTWGASGVAEFLPLGRLDAGIYGQLAKWQPRPADAVDWDSTGLDMLELSYQLPGQRSIEIDLSTYTITARVGEKVVLEAITSIGAWNSVTVTGEFSIYLKNRVQTLSGIDGNGQPYYAPNTPWVMYFFEDYAIHASLTRTAFGYADTPGCAIPPMEVAEALWLWADYGTPVSVHE